MKSKCCGEETKKVWIQTWNCEYGEIGTGDFFRVCSKCSKPIVIEKEEMRRNK